MISTEVSVSDIPVSSTIDSYNEEVSPKKRLDDVIHLAELCIEVLQQNEEHHAEVSINHHGNQLFIVWISVATSVYSVNGFFPFDVSILLYCVESE